MRIFLPTLAIVLAFACSKRYELVSDGQPIPVQVESAKKKPLAAADADIARTIDAAKPTIQACFQEGLKLDPNLAGKAIYRFVIGTTGRIQKIALEDTTLKHPRTESCIQYRLTQLSFPASDGLTQVVYPFLFRIAP